MRVLSTTARTASPRPLYAQVRDLLVARIRDGDWARGEALPNEFVLASQCGVSVGTVRRAVEMLEQQGLLKRKQGRGTFVAGPVAGAAKGRFGGVCGPDGAPIALDHVLLAVARRRPTAAEAQCLGLGADADVVEARQRLELGGSRLGLEVSVAPARLLPRLETQLVYGQDLYALYAEYGVFVTAVAERVQVVPADPLLAVELSVSPASPLLRIERLARTFEQRPVEHRVSHLVPGSHAYAVPCA